jgi:hypothetical protein
MECLEDMQERLEEKFELMPHQEEALKFLDNGKILYGGVGSGKSATAMAYYMRKEQPRDVYIITTAKKRDSLEWMAEAARVGVGTRPDATVSGTLHIDSWNNISKYEEVEGAFFILDEQRLVGHGAWVKSFLKLAKRNRWILLSATPGDVWLDYAPAFIANGYYKNITDFKRQHVVYAPYRKYPVVQGYIGEQRLERLRNEILVEMPYVKHTQRIVNYLDVGFNSEAVKDLQKRRWNDLEDRPIKDVAELWRLIRRVVNTDPSRLETIKSLMKIHPRLIVFYNFDYELELLRTLENLSANNLKVYEWNGHRHDPLPISDTWVYLVQYTAGAEGWNCTSTDAMAFYSLTYSYKNWVQSMGRIDRLDTSYTNLYYYVLKSGAYIDKALMKAMGQKKQFNERNALKVWVEEHYSYT